jgi:hypothetical protein
MEGNFEHFEPGFMVESMQRAGEYDETVLFDARRDYAESYTPEGVSPGQLEQYLLQYEIFLSINGLMEVKKRKE